MEKLNEALVSLDVEGFQTDDLDAVKTVVDTLQSSNLESEEPAELDFEQIAAEVGIGSDVEDEDEIEPSENIIADLIKDGNTTADGVDEAIRECCELIGESIENVDIDKIHTLIARANLNEDTVKQGDAWVNKGKEGTHGKFKTKKGADAQRKAMFASGYKGEAVDNTGVQISDSDILKILDKINKEYEFLYDNQDRVAGFDEAVASYDVFIQNPEFLELVYRLAIKRGDFFSSDREIGALMLALDSLGYLNKFEAVPLMEINEAAETGKTKVQISDSDIRKILDKINREYEFLYDNHDHVAVFDDAVASYDDFIQKPGFLELLRRLVVKRGDFFSSDREICALMFVLDSLGYLDMFEAGPLKEINEAAETGDTVVFVEMYTKLNDGDLNGYREDLLKLSEQDKKDYIKWANNNGIPVEELRLYMGLNETSNPDCNFGTTPNSYLTDCRATPCKMRRVHGFAANSKENEGFPLRKDDGLAPKIVAIKESAKNMLATAKTESQKRAIIRRMAGKLVTEGVSYSEAVLLLGDK